MVGLSRHSANYLTGLVPPNRHFHFNLYQYKFPTPHPTTQSALPTEPPPGVNITDAGRVDMLKTWLLQYYGSTTFNTCEHQPLPLMTGSPLKLYVNPEAAPVACHKVVSVPLHWREQVKADLERDVGIGVLEKLPDNTPVTWQSQMVVTSPCVLLPSSA